MAPHPAFTLGQLATALGATLEGDPDRVVTGVAALEVAGPSDVAFLVDGRYRASARHSRAGAFLVPDDVKDLPAPMLHCHSPRLALVDLLLLFHPEPRAAPGVDATAIVAPDARIATSASIGALSVIQAGAVIAERVRIAPLVFVGEHAEIGEDSVLHPHVVVRERVRLGRRVIVHAGAVIGGDGFGYVFDGARHRKIPQVGTVIVEDDVEIGANSTIDRAMLGTTVVGRGTKIDNLVMVAHNVQIGEHSVLAAQTGIAGSSRLGRGVVTGGQVGIGDHVTIGDGVMLGAQSGVISDIPAGERVAGTYARPVGEFKRIWAAESRLPELIQRVRRLEQRLAALENSRGRDRA
jgi:UDP-3-O-[3-hydroxymyristoyl] glucosamine N-acyltransferase